MVFQSYALYPHMTVAENMGFSMSLRGKKKAKIAAVVGDAAKILHLDDYLDRLPKNLSGGQRQRVAMGRAIVRDPKAFLFDEPLSNLDAKLRTHMRTEIRQLHQTLAATSVYVTHDQIEAMTLADRIVVMNAGRVEQVGSPIELFDRPQTQFVAGFIGAPTMNFLSGRISINDQGDAVAKLSGDNAELALPKNMERHAGKDVTIGIRPQHVAVTSSDNSAGALKAKVEMVEQTGCETNLVLTVLGQHFIAQTKERLNINAGQSVCLDLRADCLHTFDKDTTQRLD